MYTKDLRHYVITSKSMATSDTVTNNLLNSCNCSTVVIIVKGTSVREPGRCVQHKQNNKLTPTISNYAELRCLLIYLWILQLQLLLCWFELLQFIMIRVGVAVLAGAHMIPYCTYKAADATVTLETHCIDNIT